MRIHEKELFETLNQRLCEADMFLAVICVGGFVLNHYGMRATQDIDGFYKSTKKLNDIIRAVGEEFHVNTEDELWLNNSVQNMNQSPPEDICEELYAFSNLKVLIPPLDYVAGMKLISARGQDIEDVAAIIQKLEIHSPEEFLEQMGRYGFPHMDESLVLEAFGTAYGMNWLEKYFIEHEEEINQRIHSGSGY